MKPYYVLKVAVFYIHYILRQGDARTAKKNLG